jgi:hypothetical protein
MNILLGILLSLHGLVHLWYVTLSQGWVKFQADMGWTGKSWILSGDLESGLVRGAATALYGLAAALFLIAGAGLIAKQGWFQAVIIAASIVSIVTVASFWDGNFSLLVQKGALGFLLSAGFLIAALVLQWPAY